MADEAVLRKPAGRRRRIRRAAAAAALLALLAFFGAPPLIGAAIRGRVASVFRDGLGCEAQCRARFSWFTGATIEDLRVGNPSGFPQGRWLEIRRVAARPALLPLLSGRIRLREPAKVEGVSLRAEADEKGRWNLASLLPAARGSPGETGVEGEIRLSSVVVSVGAPGRAAAVLPAVDATIRLGPGVPLAFSARGAGGTLEVEGEIAPGPPGLDPSLAGGEIRYAVSPEFLEPLRPLLAAQGRPPPAGALEARGRFALEGGRPSGSGAAAILLERVVVGGRRSAVGEGPEGTREIRPGITRLSYAFRPEGEETAALILLETGADPPRSGRLLDDENAPPAALGPVTDSAIRVSFRGRLVPSSGVSGNLRVEGDIGRLAARFPGLAASAAAREARGRFAAAAVLEAAGWRTGRCAVSLTGEGIAALDAEGKPLGFREDPALRFDAEWDRAEGSLRLLNLEARLDETRVEGSVEFPGRGSVSFRGDLAALVRQARLFTAAVPENAAAGGVEGKISVSGRPGREAPFEVSVSASRLRLAALPPWIAARLPETLRFEAAGTVTADGQTAALSRATVEAGPVRAEGKGTLRAAPGGGLGAVEMESLEVRARAGALGPEARVTGRALADLSAGNFSASASADAGTAAAALGLALGETRLSGDLSLSAEARRDPSGAWPFEARVEGRALKAERPAAPGRARAVFLDEPEAVLALRGSASPDGGLAFSEGSELRSKPLAAAWKGTVKKLLTAERAAEGIEGSLSFDPVRLNPLLSALDAGRALGKDPSSASFLYTGPLPPGRALGEILREARLEARLGALGWEGGGLRVEGASLPIALADGRMAFDHVLRVNGGGVSAKGEADFRAERARAAWRWDGVGLNADLAELFSRLNPVFHTRDGRVEGKAHGSFSAAWAGPFAFSPFPAALRRPLSGTGSFSARDLKITNSPVLLDLLAGLEGPGAERGVVTGEIAETAFEALDGAVRYLGMKVRLNRTTYVFSGQVSFDGDLNLVVRAPIPSWMKERYGDKAALLGEGIEIPVGGTVKEPRLDVAGALERAAAGALQRILRERLGDVFK